MTIDQAIEEIRYYFNLDLMPHSKDRLKRILELATKEKIIEKVVTKTQYVNVTEDESKIMNLASLIEESKRIALLYNTTLSEMQGKKRDRNIVAARAHVCRYVKLNSKVTTITLGKFLKRHHTSIIYLLYCDNIQCAIGPLHKKLKTWHTL